MRRREALMALLAGPLAAVTRARAQPADLTTLTVAQAAARLAARQITPLQLTNAYLERIAKLNPSLNAYITVTADLARREAKAIREFASPLAGIPIAHKDLIETKGVKTTAGSRLYATHVPTENAHIVELLEDAGAVLLGKANTHELGAGATGVNPTYGTARNPADTTRIAGGSSSGSAVAVAAHLCAAATGTDTGGSVRIPAALCGCVGFKPTHGRISTKGVLAGSPSFDHVGFLTRTVEDAQLMWRLAYNSGTALLPSRIRVGVIREYFFDNLDSIVGVSIAQTLDRISKSADLTELRLPPTFKAVEATEFDTVFMFEFWGRYGAEWRTNPSAFSEQVAMAFKSPRPSIAAYESAVATLKTYRAEIDRLFDSIDVLAMPTVPVTAPPIAAPTDGVILLRNTWAFNAAHTPAISIPIHNTGLPVGLQLVARRGEDDKLLQIARSL
jgi:aspartyl-tRNA(Asn)/glutamyl-tRNA(Gln) amidotransferase subunit A